MVVSTSAKDAVREAHIKADAQHHYIGLMVEFVGAAGVGKSTLAGAVYDSLTKRGIPANDMEALPVRKFRPGTFVFVLRAAFLAWLIKPKSTRSFATAVKKLARYDIRRRAASGAQGVHICSEGLFHGMRAFHRESRALDMIRIADRLCRYIEPPDVVVVVQASAEIVYARRVARARKNEVFSRVSVEADVRLVEDSVRTIEHVRRRIAPSLNVIRVNVESPGISSPADVLADTLEKLAIDVTSSRFSTSL